MLHLLFSLESNTELRIRFVTDYFDRNFTTMVMWRAMKIMLSRLQHEIEADNETLEDVCPNLHTMSLLIDQFNAN